MLHVLRKTLGFVFLPGEIRERNHLFRERTDAPGHMNFTSLSGSPVQHIRALLLYSHWLESKRHSPCLCPDLSYQGSRSAKSTSSPGGKSMAGEKKLSSDAVSCLSSTLASQSVH